MNSCSFGKPMELKRKETDYIRDRLNQKEGGGMSEKYNTLLNKMYIEGEYMGGKNIYNLIRIIKKIIDENIKKGD